MQCDTRLSSSKKILQRPRLHTLIDEGLRQPVLIMLAEPGYGKTQAMVSCLEQSSAHYLWIRMVELDNVHSHFWSHLIHALKDRFPTISERLTKIDFPDNPVLLAAFLQILGEELCNEKHVVWVFDDYGTVTDPYIQNLCKALARIDLDQTCLVLISNVLNQADTLASLVTNPLIITGDDLRFTQAEIKELCALHGTSPEPGDIEFLERHTEGWALPLHLLIKQSGDIWEHSGQLSKNGGRLTPRQITSLFHENYFRAYSPELQNLLLKLSLLNTFTDTLAIRLCDGSKTTLDELWVHGFLAQEPTTGHYSFHNLYQLFLESKQYLLAEEDKQRAWKTAAAYYAETDRTIEAIVCGRNCEDPAMILELISSYIRKHYDISATEATYMMELLGTFVTKNTEQYYLAEYLRIRLSMNACALSESELLALLLKEQLSVIDTPEAQELLGEVYYLLGTFHMMSSREDFGDYFKKAAELLPNGTRFSLNDNLYMGDNHSFSMADSLPGAKERMEHAVHYGVPWMSKVLHGGMSGMEHIFSAEANYLSYQLDEAERHAYQALYQAKQSAQLDLVCNAHLILARIGFLRGSYQTMTQHIQSIGDCVREHQSTTLNAIQDTALGWYCVKVRDLERFPQSIKKLGDLGDAPFLRGRSQIVYADYLLNTGQFAKFVGVLEYPQGLYLSKGLWSDRIYQHVMISIGYLHLGDHEASLKALKSVYDMSYENGLITPFIEQEEPMCTLVHLAQQQTTYTFADEWLTTLDEQAALFAKRASAVRTHYNKVNIKEGSFRDPLTKREKEVLEALFLGLTREEIAATQFISVNTVKTFLRSIYAKLNASNKTDAISTALRYGYLDPTVGK